MKKLFAVLLLSLPCLAQTDCPVSIKSISAGEYVVRPITIDYKNNSDKVLIGVKFSYEWMDATGSFAFADYATEAYKVKPLKGRSLYWNVYQKYPYGIRVAVDSVSFSDGTTWKDDGTMKCSKVEDYRGK